MCIRDRGEGLAGFQHFSAVLEVLQADVGAFGVQQGGDRLAQLFTDEMCIRDSVYSDQAFTSVGSPGYYDPTTFVEGWNHLDGKAALAFARERHAFKTGDVQRGINQMKVIDAMPVSYTHLPHSRCQTLRKNCNMDIPPVHLLLYVL